jgi:SOS regulatory protein LexA
MMLHEYTDKLYRFYDSNKRMPTYGEMTKLFGFRSKNAVYKVVGKLVDAGAVAKDHLGRLTPTKLFGEVKMLGLIEAGIPSPAEEEVLDTTTLDEWLVRDRESTYILRVKGDSMVDAGIFEGDFVLVERTDKHKIGDIVVAYIDGQWTLKYLRQNTNGYYLQPGNKKYADIHPTEELKVAAVVRSVIRRYGN